MVARYAYHIRYVSKTTWRIDNFPLESGFQYHISYRAYTRIVSCQYAYRIGNAKRVYGHTSVHGANTPQRKIVTMNINFYYDSILRLAFADSFFDFLCG